MSVRFLTSFTRLAIVILCEFPTELHADASQRLRLALISHCADCHDHSTTEGEWSARTAATMPSMVYSVASTAGGSPS